MNGEGINWLVVACLACGCGSGDVKGAVDSLDSVLGVAEQVGEVEGQGLPDLTGRAYRITEFHLESPGTSAEGGGTEGTGTFDMPLVLYVAEYEAATGELTMKLGPTTGKTGSGDSSGPVWAMEPATFGAHLDGLSFKSVGTFNLNVATEKANQALVVEKVVASGTFAPDAQRIEIGLLKGLIWEGSAQSLCLVLDGMGTVNYHWFLNLAAICPTLDTDGDGVCDSYPFVAYFNCHATLPDFDGDALGVYEPEVDDCPGHSEPCEAGCFSCVEYADCAISCAYDKASTLFSAAVTCGEKADVCVAVETLGPEPLNTTFDQCSLGYVSGQGTPVDHVECCYQGLGLACYLQYEDSSVVSAFCTVGDVEVQCAADSVVECPEGTS